jgi:hypothetical protein
MDCQGRIRRRCRSYCHHLPYSFSSFSSQPRRLAAEVGHLHHNLPVATSFSISSSCTAAADLNIILAFMHRDCRVVVVVVADNQVVVVADNQVAVSTSVTVFDCMMVERANL